MLPSDPSPKATSVPRFKVGDKVRLKDGADLRGELLYVGPDIGTVKWETGVRSDVYLEGLELVFDVTPATTNNVDHPSHYTAGSIETIDAIEAMVGQKGWSPLTGYRLGNVLKYLWRHVHKGGVESLKKARWYLDREIEQQEAAAPPKVTP